MTFSVMAHSVSRKRHLCTYLQVLSQLSQGSSVALISDAGDVLVRNSKIATAAFELLSLICVSVLVVF